MAQLSGLYGPAVALGGIGDTISDMMKTWAGLKIQEAKMELEGKQQDVNLARVMGEMEIAKSKAGFETAKAASEERFKDKELGLKTMQVGSEIERNKALTEQGRAQLGVSQAHLTMAQKLHDLTVKDKERQSEMITGQQFVDEMVGMPPVMRDYISNVIPESLQKSMPRSEWVNTMKTFMEKNPKYAVAQIAGSLKTRYDQLNQTLQSLPTDPQRMESSEKIAVALTTGAGGLYETMTAMQNLQMLLEEDNDTAMKVAALISKDETDPNKIDPVAYERNLSILMKQKAQIKGIMSQVTAPEDIKGHVDSRMDAWKYGVKAEMFVPQLVSSFVTETITKSPKMSPEQFEKKAQTFLNGVTKKYGPRIATEATAELKKAWNERKVAVAQSEKEKQFGLKEAFKQSPMLGGGPTLQQQLESVGDKTAGKSAAFTEGWSR